MIRFILSTILLFWTSYFLSGQERQAMNANEEGDYEYMTGTTATFLESGSTGTICDTLNFPLPGTYTYYIVTNTGSGYVSGNNSFQDLAKANYFSEFPLNRDIKGVIYDFVIAKKGSSDEAITFAIWDNNGFEGAPGDILESKTMPLSAIVENVANSNLTYIEFDDPVEIEHPFYAGLILPSIPGDTLVLYTNTHGDSPAGIAWELWSGNVWYAYSDNNTWGLNISNAIHPVLCEPSGSIDEVVVLNSIQVFPNPVERLLNITLATQPAIPVNINIYSIMGNLLYSGSFDPSKSNTISIDMAKFSKGLYFIILEAGGKKVTRKIYRI